DRDQRGDDEDRLARQRFLERLRGPGERRPHAGRQADLGLSLADGVDGLTERDAGREVERDGPRRELALVADRQRRRPRLEVREGRERNLIAGARFQIDAIERARVLRILRPYLEDHAVLVELGEDGAHLALAESIVER